MLGSTIIPVAVASLATLGAIFTAVWTSRGGERVKRIEATTPTYAQMVERLSKVESAVDEERALRRSLEDRVDLLEDDRRHDRMWIERTIRKVIDHDPQLVVLLLPWPGWVTTTPPTLD